jgi:hypothetical protein
MATIYNISQDIPTNITLPKAKFQKMVFIMNALQDGWSVKKNKNSYIFYKKHENKKEVFDDEYLETFIQTKSNMNFSEI